MTDAPAPVTPRQHKLLTLLADPNPHALTARQISLHTNGTTNLLDVALIRSALDSLEKAGLVDSEDVPAPAGTLPPRRPERRYHINELGRAALTTTTTEPAASTPPSARYTTVRTADEVTAEMLDRAVQLADSFYGGTRVDWDDLMDRLDGMDLADGTTLDLTGSAAITGIRAHVSAIRRTG